MGTSKIFVLNYAFFLTFVTLIGNVPPKCFLIELGCKIMNYKKIGMI